MRVQKSLSLSLGGKESILYKICTFISKSRVTEKEGEDVATAYTL